MTLWEPPPRSGWTGTLRCVINLFFDNDFLCIISLTASERLILERAVQYKNFVLWYDNFAQGGSLISRGTPEFF